MQIKDYIRTSALEEYERLKLTLEDVNERIAIIDKKLFHLREESYVYTRPSVGQDNSLGSASNASRRETLPESFFVQNKEIVDKQVHLLMEQRVAEDEIRGFRDNILKDIANTAAAEYLILSSKVSEIHGLLGAIGTQQRNVNNTIWREMKIPACIPFGNLDKKSDLVYGRPMLHHYLKSDKQRHVFQTELQTLLK